MVAFPYGAPVDYKKSVYILQAKLVWDTYVWDRDNGCSAHGDDLAVGSALSWVRFSTWGGGDIARVSTSGCWVSWGSDSDGCGGLGLDNVQCMLE